MEPDGWATVVICVMASVVCLGLSAWYWPALVGKNFVARAKQLGVLLSSAVLILIMSFSVANAQQHWYRTWYDIGHAISPPTHVEPADPIKGAHPTESTQQQVESPFAGISHTTDRRDRIKPSDLTADKYGGHLTVTVPGAASGHQGKAEVWFPPSYFEGDGSEEYPVLFAYVGYPSVLDSYRKAADIGTLMKQLQRDKKMKTPIVVVPAWAPQGIDTECTDTVKGSLRLETWLTQDLPKWLIENTAAARTRDSWAALGFSAGGFCALSSALHHPQLFGAAISYIGYSNAHFESRDPKNDTWDRSGKYDLVKHLQKNQPPVAIWAFTTSSEELGGARMRELRDAAQAPASVTLVDANIGGHTFDTWKPYIGPSLTWLGSVSPGFSVSGSVTTPDQDTATNPSPSRSS